MATRWCDSLKNRHLKSESYAVETVLSTLWLSLMSLIAMMTCEKLTWAAGCEVRSEVLLFVTVVKVLAML